MTAALCSCLGFHPEQRCMGSWEAGFCNMCSGLSCRGCGALGPWFSSLCKCIVRGSTETNLVAKAGRLLLPQLVLVLFIEHCTVTAELGGKGWWYCVLLNQLCSSLLNAQLNQSAK